MGTPTEGQLIRILDVVDGARAGGGTVYVHCWGGVGRTGTVIGCWLVRHGRTGDEALAELARLFATMSESKRRRHPKGSPETSAQREMVRNWAANDDPRPPRERFGNDARVRNGWRHDPESG